MTGDRAERIRTSLERAFAPTELEIIDESHLHAGHAGAKEGKGHFRVRIVSHSFAGRKPLQCHRMVFDVLADLLQTDIHALSLTAMPPHQATVSKQGLEEA